MKRALACALLLSACLTEAQRSQAVEAQDSSAPDSLEVDRCTNVRRATSEEIEQIRIAMEEGLFDAQSARFLRVSVCAEDPKGMIVCGKLNAKNQYGAYVGYVAFTGLFLEGQYLNAGVDDKDSDAAAQVCKASGLL